MVGPPGLEPGTRRL